MLEKIDTSKLSICLNRNGVKFGFLEETDIENQEWKKEVKEFTDIDGKVRFVSTKHIDSRPDMFADNIYPITNILERFKTQAPNRIFLDYEVRLISEIFDLGQVDYKTLKEVEINLSSMLNFRFSPKKNDSSTEME